MIRTLTAVALMMMVVPPAPALDLPPALGRCLEAETDAGALGACRLIATGPGNPEIRLAAAIRAAEIMSAAGDHQAAVELLEGMQLPLELTPSHSRALGDVEFARGDYDMALFHYEIAILFGGETPELLAWIAEVEQLFDAQRSRD